MDGKEGSQDLAASLHESSSKEGNGAKQDRA